ncbi:MAG: lamin tail domain-containing protein [Pseudomonadota bacterium]
MTAKGFALLGAIYSTLLIPINSQAAVISDLLISEIMANPSAITDSNGEWFELYNPTGNAINLLNSTLSDDGSDIHVIETDLLVLPGHFLTLARSNNPGFTPDYVYQNFRLGNSDDEIRIESDSGEVLSFSYLEGFVAPGISTTLLDLSGSALSYHLSTLTLGFNSGDVGTPGSFEFNDTDIVSVPAPATLGLFLVSMLGVLSLGTRRNVSSVFLKSLKICPMLLAKAGS